VQKGLEGAATIQTVTFGVVLTSITLTAVLVIGLERAPLRGVAAWWFRAFGAAAPATAVAAAIAPAPPEPPEPG